MACACLTIYLTTDGDLTEIVLGQDSTINGQFSYTFNYFGTDWRIWFSGTSWVISAMPDYTNPAYFLAYIEKRIDCPDSSSTGFPWQILVGGLSISTITSDCPILCDKEDRLAVEYKSVKLPQNFSEEARGIEDCCCEELVLASNSNDSWKSDVTSAWVKLSDPSDTFVFKLKKNGLDTTYVCVVNAFPKELNAYYTTINWIDVLNLLGTGCYQIVIEYSISGIVGNINWGKYNLKEYSIQNALSTARLRAVFNGKQESDNIDFTDSNVVSTLRFYGFIGNRQPNSEIDNLIYSNREMKRVIRENLYSYEIITDPLDECIIKQMTEIYLLSENQLFISDYNAHNHSYRYNDIPVIVEESPEINYFEFSRKASLTCTVGDKFKANRTYYN
jgi:hypothetical protein